VLDGWLGAAGTRVILPITDPYVVHHGALGSYATVYLPAAVDCPRPRGAARGAARHRHGARRPEAASRFELPADRIGDLVVVSGRSVALGGCGRQARPLGPGCAAALARGLSEQAVPLVMNRRIQNLDANRRWRNFDAFDWLLNHAP